MITVGLHNTFYQTQISKGGGGVNTLGRSGPAKCVFLDG